MKSKQSNWLRALLQWGVLAAIAIFIVAGNCSGNKVDPEAYCPFGGLQALGSYLLNNSLACSMSMVQIMMGVMLAIGVLLFSKLFCGYLCPLGTVGEFLSRGGRKMKMSYDIANGTIADKVLRIFKYVLLFVVFYMSVSSSELFCKNLDPYYAVATGFKGEITAWMVWITIALLFLGNIFIKMFWCKYICPLGALSNIFKFSILFVGILILVWILGLTGLANGWVWALGLACLVSYIFEITCMKNKTYQLLNITRDNEKCIDCGICDKKCPYSIKVSEMDKVKQVDCTLCEECVYACPTDALEVSKKRSLRWLPAALTAVLFVFALILGKSWELPTIDEKWGEWEKVENLKTYEMEGLTSVKCFGSSKAFSAQMKKVPGVYGVKTYVKRFAAVISYDPAVIDETGIQKAVFTPTKMKYSTPPEAVDTLRIMKLGVEGLFDKNDMVYFGNILRKIDGIYGFKAEFACPVDVWVYTDPNVKFDQKVLKDSIGAKETTMLVHGGGTRSIKINYTLESYDPDAGKISRLDFVEMMFDRARALSAPFKENAEKYADSPIAVYEMAYPAIEKPLAQRNFPYLRSYLSLQDGLVGIDVTLKGVTPVIQIKYVKGMWDDAKIWSLIKAEKWYYKNRDGDIVETPTTNILSFTEEGRTI